jgi:hypothetical protein
MSVDEALRHMETNAETGLDAVCVSSSLCFFLFILSKSNLILRG